jgi:hypothetical protein
MYDFPICSITGHSLLSISTLFKNKLQHISYIMASGLLVEETGGLHRPAASHWETLSHNVVLLVLRESRTHNISATIMPLGERLAMLIYCMSIQIIEKIN